MSWFDRVGDALEWVGDATGIGDVVTEVADAFDPNGEMGVLPFGMDERQDVAKKAAVAIPKTSLGIPIKAAMAAGNAYYTHVAEPLHDTLVYGILALQAPLWRRDDLSLGAYLAPGSDAPGSAWGARDNLSLGEAMMAGGAGLAQRVNLGAADRVIDPMLRGMGAGVGFAAISPLLDNNDRRWDSFDPVNRPRQSMEFFRSTNNRYVTGTIDFTKDIFLDPLTFAGAPIKAVNASMRGATVVAKTAGATNRSAKAVGTAMRAVARRT